MIIADFHCGHDRSLTPAGIIDPGYGMPVHAVDLEFLHGQIIGVTDDDAIGFRIEIDNVTPLRRPTGQAFALADGEKLDPIVLADEISIDIVNRAAMKFAFAKMRAQERFVIAPGHKTDFLAVNFVGNFQA